MGEIVAVDHQELTDAVNTMNRSFSVFSALVENAFSTELEVLDLMNSDYVDELMKVLTAAKNWKMKSLQKNIGKYIAEADEINKKIKEKDTALAKHMQPEK